MHRSYRKTVAEIVGREPVHPFPARMAPGIALEVLSDTKKPLRVLDPMMGSGTVLAVARSKGHHAIGVDIDPLAVLISRVWTRATDLDEVRGQAAEVLSKARATFKTLRSRDAYPPSATQKTREFVAYWFDDYARRQLTSLATHITRIRSENTRDLLWCAFSRLIITKQAGASLAMDLAHSRPHRAFDRAPIKPFRRFLASVERVTSNCIAKHTDMRGPATRIYQGDARNLRFEDGIADLILSSPPYLNAIDYFRCSKFSLVWMGHQVGQLRDARSRSIGAEAACYEAEGDPETRVVLSDLGLGSSLPSRLLSTLRRYIYDMKLAAREAARVLRPTGTAVYVVGENSIRGVFIRNSQIMTAVAELAGLHLKAKHTRTLPGNRRYLPPPLVGRGRSKLHTRMGCEVVLAYAKSSH